MNLKSRKSGISLISLIITIIVIIILAAIVIFSGMDTPEKAQLSKVISDIDNVQTAVDQAYYGLYTEKAVAGEVWTQSQFYEAVATGEKNRDNLTGTGLVEISENSLVDINLPIYEGRKWYVAVSDMSDTVKVGSAVLSPGFESQGKTYATLLDIQNGGSDGASSNGNINEPTLADMVKVGDYIDYTPDKNTYSTNTENTGWSSSQELTTAADTAWRVLYIDPDTNEVLITTQGIVNGGTYLSGTKGYLRGASELNTICEKLYSKELYGKNGSSLTLKARSMTIEDLDKACGITEKDKIDAGYGTRYAYYPNGTTFAEDDTTIEYNGNTYKKKVLSSSTAKFYTYDGGGVETTDSDGFTYSTPQADNPVYVTQTYYWYNPSDKNTTVGSILVRLGQNWLASTCVRLSSSYAAFYVYSACSGGVNTYVLYYSEGYFGSHDYGVCPLVSLGSKLQIDTSDTSRDGSTSEKAWKIMLKE